VTHLGVDAAFHPCGDEDRLARVRTRYAIPSGVPYVLSLAQMDFRKNTGRLMRAFVRMVEQEHISDLQLVLAGGFWQAESAVRRAWEALGPLRDRVHFIGWVEEEDLSPLYSGAEAFAFPSLAEGFGLPPLEAMRCGVPVVAGNATSLPEVVGDAALTVDPTDEDALAQALLDLHRSPTLRGDLARRGLDRSAAFTWESFGDKCLAAYREAGAAVA
jgi:glycosyltransferase involved in cell wall biosynthesis